MPGHAVMGPGQKRCKTHRLSYEGSEISGHVAMGPGQKRHKTHGFSHVPRYQGMSFSAI